MGYSFAWELGKQDRAQASPQGTQASLTGSPFPSEDWSAFKPLGQECTEGPLSPRACCHPMGSQQRDGPFLSSRVHSGLDYSDARDCSPSTHAAGMLVTGSPSHQDCVNGMIAWMLCLWEGPQNAAPMSPCRPGARVGHSQEPSSAACPHGSVLLS